MKLYTLNYNCNVPTTQQINVPTNTNYKVGIKVTRNGKEQNLKPAEVKLYTGKSTVIEPTDFNADKELATSTDAMIVALLPASISADLGGKIINTVVPEVSYDNGATWGEVHATTEFDQYFFVMDKSQGNYYCARLGLKNPRSKWELLDGTKTGVVGTSATITMPTNPQAFLNTNSGQWSITQFPCVFRLVIKYGGYTDYEYVSPDADLTNGYMTFTRSTEDEAFGEADIIDIQHAQDSTVEIQKYTNNTGAQVSRPGLSCSAAELGLTGKTIYPDMMKMAATYALTEQPTDAELKAEADTYWNWTFRTDTPSLIFRTAIMISGTQGVIYSMTGDPAGAPTYKQALLDAGLWDGVRPIFFFVPPGAANFTAKYSYTFDGSETIVYKNVKLPNGKSNGGYLELDYDQPFDAQFKLTTNAFKSQQGDIADDASTGRTTTLSGEYSDGTGFNYNIVIA